MGVDDGGLAACATPDMPSIAEYEWLSNKIIYKYINIYYIIYIIYIYKNSYRYIFNHISIIYQLFIKKILNIYIKLKN